MVSQIQSVLFEKELWTVAKAKAWLKKHKLRYGKVDSTERLHRFRQIDPAELKGAKMRTKSIGDGIHMIFAFLPKGALSLSGGRLSAFTDSSIREFLSRIIDQTEGYIRQHVNPTTSVRNAYTNWAQATLGLANQLSYDGEDITTYDPSDREPTVYEPGRRR